MRTFAFLTVTILLVCSAIADTYTLSEDWNQSLSGKRVYAVALNPATNHLLIAMGVPGAGANSRIGAFNPETGADLGSSLPNPAGIPNTYFSMTVADDGKIYAFVYEGNTYRWDNESATPVQLTVSGGNIGYIRSMRAYGSGTSTVIFAVGDNDDTPIDKWTTTDPALTNWTCVRLDNTAAKSGVSAITPDLTTLYAIQPWGADETVPNAGFPERYDLIGSAWTRSATFAPPEVWPDDPGTPDVVEGAASYSIGGDYADGALWVLYYINGLSGSQYLNKDIIWGLDGTTAAEVAEYISPANIAYYGSVDADSTNKKIYWGAPLAIGSGDDPSAAQDNSIYGRLSYTISTPTPIPTPSPTPEGYAAASGSWTIYE
jgi:hypothetical protein